MSGSVDREHRGGVQLRRRLEQRLEELPVLPQSVVRLTTLDRTTESYFDELVEVIESDPAFSARLLSLANSAAFAPVGDVTSIRGAVTRVGGSVAADLILGVGVTRVFTPRDVWERSMWRHSLQVAAGCRSLAPHATPEPLDPGECYAAGLLHDIGRFVMFQEAPDLLRAIDEGDWDHPEALVEQERAICGITHAEIGEAACARWHLPQLIGFVSAHHHDLVGPTGASTIGPAHFRHVVDLVRFVDLAVFRSVSGEDPDTSEKAMHALRRLAPDSLGIEVSTLAAMITDAAASADLVAEALGT